MSTNHIKGHFISSHTYRIMYKSRNVADMPPNYKRPPQVRALKPVQQAVTPPTVEMAPENVGDGN